jgi:transposase
MKQRILYVGMDVHLLCIVICVMDQQGKILSRSVIETSTQAVKDFFHSLRGQVHATFEEGTLAAWLYDVVEPLVHRLIVCNPKYNKQWMGKNRNDRIDAATLAELLRLNAVKAVYHDEHGTRTLKPLMRSYECFATDITRVKNRLKALYNSRVIRSRGRELYHVSKREMGIEKLQNAGERKRAELLFLPLEELKKLKRAAQKAMMVDSRKHAAHEILSRVPELGPVRVAQIIATVDTPYRFRTKRTFWKYLGCAVEMRSSSDHEIVDGRVQRRNKQGVETRGLNEDYNRRLKAIFKSAAAHSCRCGVYKEYYEGLLKRGMRPEMARLAVARKLTATVLAVWKSGESFDEERIMSEAA